MSVHSINERLLTEKPKLMKQTLLTEMFTKDHHRNITSSQESISDTQVIHDNDDRKTNDLPPATCVCV